MSLYTPGKLVGRRGGSYILWINWETELGIVLVLVSDLGRSFPLVVRFPVHQTEAAFGGVLTGGEAGGCLFI